MGELVQRSIDDAFLWGVWIIFDGRAVGVRQREDVLEASAMLLRVVDGVEGVRQLDGQE